MSWRGCCSRPRPTSARRALTAFVETLAERLLTYAMGRGVEYDDKPAIRALLREARPSEYRWSLPIVNLQVERFGDSTGILSDL